MKSPVLFSFGVSVLISVVVSLLWQGMTRNIDEHAFIMAGMFVMFPFIWFITWLIVNAIVWWREVRGGNTEEDGSAPDPGQAGNVSKKSHKLRKT